MSEGDPKLRPPDARQEREYVVVVDLGDGEIRRTFKAKSAEDAAQIAEALRQQIMREHSLD